MGLDNGIIIKNKNGIEEEICYWRKCWNIRKLIFDCIDSNEMLFEYSLSLDDLVDIYQSRNGLQAKNRMKNDVKKCDKELSTKLLNDLKL